MSFTTCVTEAGIQANCHDDRRQRAYCSGNRDAESAWMSIISEVLPEDKANFVEQEKATWSQSYHDR